jgi:hypothetical protein
MIVLVVAIGGFAARQLIAPAPGLSPAGGERRDLSQVEFRQRAFVAQQKQIGRAHV